MADCGASGSALDRATSSIISSALGGESNHQNAALSAATSKAGKAISTFLGGAASHHHVATTGQLPLMPSAPPESLLLDHAGSVSTNSSSMESAWKNVSRNAPTSMSTLSAYGSNRQQPQMHHSEIPHAYHHPSTQMQMGPNYHRQHHLHGPQDLAASLAMQRQHQHHQQMQMMNQHMMMMQMSQQQFLQQQQQQHQQQQQTMESQKQAQSSNLKEEKSDTIINEKEGSNATTENTQGNQYENAPSFQDAENWHDGLIEDFQSHMQINRHNQSLDDVASTSMQLQSEELGHEGYVEGASIEQLAEAWAEAERISGNIDAEDNDYVDTLQQNQSDDVETTYEFSEESRFYGLSSSEIAAAQLDTATATDSNHKADLMAQGMKHFQQGNISEAKLYFESELQNNDPDNSDAWLMLGKCHAENDQDQKAIISLERAVERDPYSSEALLALGVSYLNELDHDRALIYLKNWVTHHPNYAGMAMADEVRNHGGALEELKSLLQLALDFGKEDGENSLDSSVDVLEVLGVTCNLTREYDKAAEYFQSATKLKPNDYQLWNKLGATLANGNRSAEALPAYHKALSLKPKYARAWLNMAISHGNLRNHEEASRCYLQTLSLNKEAMHVWSYLRISLTASERWDLMPLAAARDLDKFKDHFDFVQY